VRVWSNGLRGEDRERGACHLRVRIGMGSLELQAQVAQAVHILNHDTQSVNRVAANQWLVQFQNTDAAWEVATTILAMDSSPTIDFEVELFAGQVLKRKVRF
jgi:transportin-3